MVKKSLIAVMGLMLMFTAVPALAQSEAGDDLTPEIIEALKKEPPLSQADIDTFVKVIPEMSKAAEKDPAEAVKIYKAAGLSENRFGLIYSKVMLGMFLAAGIPREELTFGPDMPEVLMPTDDDLKLIEKNLEALSKALDPGQ